MFLIVPAFVKSDPTVAELLYLFGAEVGDSVVRVDDEASSTRIDVIDGVVFPFFGVTRNAVCMSRSRPALIFYLCSQARSQNCKFGGQLQCLGQTYFEYYYTAIVR